MRRAIFAALAAVTICFASPAPVLAQEQLDVRKVDTTKFPEVRITALVQGATPNLRDFALRENGKIVRDFDVVPIGEALTTSLGIVLVIDTSGSMRPGGKLEQAKTAARQFVEQKLPNDRIAVVAFSNEPRVVVNLTNDQTLLRSAIDGLQPSGETALWDAVRSGATLLAEAPDLLPYLVVLSDGADTVSRTSADDAIASVTSARAVAFPVGLRGGGEFDAAGLRRLADATSGAYAETSDARELGRLYAAVQRAIQNQYEISYASTATGPFEITLQAGGARASASAAPNSLTTGSSNQPRAVSAPAAPGPFGSTTGAVVAAACIGLAALLLASLVISNLRREAALEETLRPYLSGSGGRAAAADADESRDRSFAHTAFVRRAVATTGRLAEQRGILRPLEVRLEQADLRLSASEALFFYVASVFLVFVIGLALGGPLMALIVLLFAGLLPAAALNYLAERRRKAFSSQLPDTLMLLASSLRAGYSLMQGLEAVSTEADDPMGRELRRVVLESRLGRPLEDSLDDTAKRMGSPDFDWVVMAIKIQREVGGNLAELLTTVADTMIARERLRREVSALTAEGKLSAIVLVAMPVVIAGVMYVLNPSYISILFASTMGKAMLLGATVVATAGFFWMQKMIKVEI